MACAEMNDGGKLGRTDIRGQVVRDIDADALGLPRREPTSQSVARRRKKCGLGQIEAQELCGAPDIRFCRIVVSFQHGSRCREKAGRCLPDLSWNGAHV